MNFGPVFSVYFANLLTSYWVGRAVYFDLVFLFIFVILICSNEDGHNPKKQKIEDEEDNFSIIKLAEGNVTSVSIFLQQLWFLPGNGKHGEFSFWDYCIHFLVNIYICCGFSSFVRFLYVYAHLELHL